MVDARDTGIRLTYVFACDCVFTLTLEQLLGDATIRAALGWLRQLHGQPIIVESALVPFSKFHSVGM